MSRKIPITITHEEFMKLYNGTKHHHHKIALALGFFNCLRVSEVCNLLPEHVDKGRKLLLIKAGKGNKDRNIPIAPEVLNGLRYLPVGVKKRALQDAIEKLSIKVLGRRIHFHTLRHSGATYYLNQKKWDVRQLQVLLGHSRISITEIYTHVNPQDLVEKMGW